MKNLLLPVLLLAGLFALPLASAEDSSNEKENFLPVVRWLHAGHANHRAARGLRPQILDSRLCSLAQRWAESMANRRQMSHSSYGLRENVAAGQRDAGQALQAWINSGGHNANLLSGDRAVGFGAAVAANGGIYWCSIHGSPQAPPQTPAAVQAPVQKQGAAQAPTQKGACSAGSCSANSANSANSTGTHSTGNGLRGKARRLATTPFRWLRGRRGCG